MISLSLQPSEYFRYPLVFSSGELARQANASIKVVFDETIVLVATCMSSVPREGIKFLPLTVEYQARGYAMGKIPGGFIKREGRPKDGEILRARLIDRTLRPFFPEGFSNEVQIVAMVLSSDGNNDPDILAINAASCALLSSDIPFTTPIGAVRVSKIEDVFIINPTYEEREKSPIDLILAGTEDRIVMIEGNLKETPESDIVEAIQFAHPAIKEIIKVQLALQEKIGKKKIEVVEQKIDGDVLKTVEDKFSPRMEEIYELAGKEERIAAVDSIISELENQFKERDDISVDIIKEMFSNIEQAFVRNKILRDGIRPDGRSIEEIRSIDCKVSVLPRTHGSALFTRGQTQSLAIITLGTISDEQIVESLEGRKSKHFMLQYVFPSFSVGEVRPMRGPSRREIGHGALAEKSIYNMLPEKDEFPYTIRVVSEILESNGSSSMATVCATSLALMDAGVPLKNAVAGIALGLVEGDDGYKILTDIAGIEDHCGDMDFKIAGTKKGITAIQLDVKNKGLDSAIIAEALARAKTARLSILEKMDKVLSKGRDSVSKYSPKIKAFVIASDKIGSVIGPGGRIIRKLSRDHNVTIDIDDETSKIFVVASTEKDLKEAVDKILIMTRDITPGEIYDVKVVKLTNFGAFCELSPGKDGLLHISELSNTFVKDIKDVLKEGDIIKVKVINVDPGGKISLSKKQAE